MNRDELFHKNRKLAESFKGVLDINKYSDFHLTIKFSPEIQKVIDVLVKKWMETKS